MAKSTRQYVFEGMEVLPEALVPFVEKRLESALTGHWQIRVAEKLRLHAGPNGDIDWDQAVLLNAMDRFWTDAFKTVLGRAERSIVNELVAVRNKLSHNETFTYDDAERALDSMRRLMEAIGAGSPAEQLGKMRDTILRTKFTELQRNEERRKTQRLVEISVDTVGGLLPWREVVEPHQASRPVSSCRRSSLPISARSTPAARLRNTAFRGSSSAAPISPTDSARFWSARPGGSPARAANRWSNFRPTSAAARPTPCWRFIMWRAGRRRGTCPASTSFCRSTTQRCRNTSTARFWSARGAAHRT